MAGTVYSTRFVASLLTATNDVYYTVPAGYVAVVRTMTLAGVAPAAGAGTAQVELGGSNSRVWMHAVQNSEIVSEVWNGRLVLPPGETIRASISGTTVPYLTVSGYLLQLP